MTEQALYDLAPVLELMLFGALIGGITVGVMAASAPGILVAGLAVFILMSRRSRMQPCADA